MSNQTIDVCLTVDVEFSVNYAPVRPGRRPLGAEWVRGPVDGRSQGLGFLLDCLDRYALKGTFFTEVFNTYYFGDDPMAEIAGELSARGQDVQLHLHPIWLYYKDAPERAALSPGRPPGDSFTDHAVDELADWLTDGADILQRMTGTRPIAFRSGNLDSGRVLYAGLRRAGLEFASNIGVGYTDPVEPELRQFSGLCHIDDVIEVPVTTYRPPIPRDRLLLLTATGSAFAEMRAVLEDAHRRGVGPVVVLLHPHDFHIPMNRDSDGPIQYRRDVLRQTRLEWLCRYLADAPDRFEVTTFSAAAQRWREQAETGRNDLLTGSLAGLGVRLVENKLLPMLRGLPQ